MDVLRRASAVVFTILGALTILSIVLVNRGIATAFLSTFLNIVDLPLLFTGMLYGGSALVSSLGKDRTSVPLMIVVFLPLLLLFGFFVWLNFGMPFPG